MKRCKGTTRSGRPCREIALPGTNYCSIKFHQQQIKKKWYSKVKCFVRNHKGLSVTFSIVVGIIVVIQPTLSFFSDSIQIYSVFTQDNKRDIRDTVKPILSNTEEIIALLREQFKVNRVELKKKYSLGYALFYTDGKEIFAPYDVSERIEIDWSKAKLVSFSDKNVAIIVPSVKTKTASVEVSDVSIVLSRRAVNKPFPFFATREGELSASLLVNEQSYVVGVIGFKRFGEN